MEALVILLAEFLTALLIPALVVAAEVAALLLSLLFDLIAFLCFGRRKAIPPAPSTRTSARKRSWRITVQSWGAAAWQIRKAAFIGLVLTVGVLVLANTVFFEPTVRLILAVAGHRTGTELAFKSVSGNLFTGQFVFQDLSARRVSETKSSFDLKVGHLSMDLDLVTLIAPPIVFDTLTADTVTGTFRQPDRIDARGGRDDQGGRIAARRKFRVEALTLRNVDVALSRGEAAAIAVSLKSAASVPFRSNFAVFDMLFRSNVLGQVEAMTSRSPHSEPTVDA
jgi:hypothetical protein